MLDSSLMGQIILYVFLAFTPIIILMVASMWKIFVKAGQPGWACLIPIYSSIILCDIIKKPRLWTLWMLIPYVGIVFGIWAINLLAKSFGKSSGYTVGLLLLPFIFWPMLAFGKSQYLLKDETFTSNNSDILDA